MFFRVSTDKNIGTLFMWLIATTPDDFKAERKCKPLMTHKDRNPEKLTLTFYLYFIPRRQFGIAKRILFTVHILSASYWKS